MTAHLLTLRRKLAGGFLLGALVPLLISASLVYMKTSSGLRRIERAQLVESTAAVENTMAQQQQAGLGLTAASVGFPNDVARHSGAKLTRDLWAMVQALNLVQAEVHDVHGRLLAQASVLPSPRPLGHSRSSFSFQAYLGKLWLVSNVPIRADGGRGAPLDD